MWEIKEVPYYIWDEERDITSHPSPGAIKAMAEGWEPFQVDGSILRLRREVIEVAVRHD